MGRNQPTGFVAPFDRRMPLQNLDELPLNPFEPPGGCVSMATEYSRE